jgi:hypothetical protein
MKPVDLKIGDVVEIMESGDPEQDLMYRGWKATVTNINDDSGEVWVNSDSYTKRTGKIQAVSFKKSFPAKLLKTICSHEETRFMDHPDEPGLNTVEVCNLCGMSRSHWEQGETDWLAAP